MAADVLISAGFMEPRRMATLDADAHERNQIRAEIDGFREAIRLNWLEMEQLDLLQVERQAIRATVAGLVQTVAGLLAKLEQ